MDGLFARWWPHHPTSPLDAAEERLEVADDQPPGRVPGLVDETN